MLTTCNSKIVKNIFEEKRYVSPYIILKWGLDKNIPIGELSFKLKDEEYRKFQSKLIPTVAPERIIGVRMPMLRKLVKEFLKNGDTECFLMELPHKYYEEDIIHALVIAQICDFEKALTEIR